MSWADVANEANKAGKWLDLRDGDECDLRIIGQPVTVNKISRNGDQYTKVEMQVMRVGSEAMQTLSVMPWQVKGLVALQATHPASEWEYHVQVVGKQFVWSPLDRTPF